MGAREELLASGYFVNFMGAGLGALLIGYSEKARE